MNPLDAVLDGAPIAEVASALIEGTVIDAGQRFRSPARRLQRALDNEAARRDFEQVPTFDRWISTAYKDPEFEHRGGWGQLKKWKSDYQQEHGDLMRYHVGGETGLIGRRHVPALRRLQRTYGLHVKVRPADSTVILTPRRNVGEEALLTEIGMKMQMRPPPAVARPYRIISDADRKDAGWIEPNGRTHTLGHDEIHSDWVQDRPELWSESSYRGLQKANERGDDTYDRLARQMGRMMKQGWIRKAAKDMYHVHDRAHVGRVLQHVRRWHPDVKEFAVDIGPRAHTSLTIDTETGWPTHR